MFEAEIMIAGYTVVVVACSLSLAALLWRKKIKALQKEISYLKTCLSLKNEPQQNINQPD
ncbi:MAG: hypothetical protein CK426_05875 [Legionella sp.]|nr:MAG: hypothetical protein CK423_05315 [Legionella sp.]PJD98569.1 MAG: hypothetical protein CK426_05875 [Legionella sp.]